MVLHAAGQRRRHAEGQGPRVQLGAAARLPARPISGSRASASAPTTRASTRRARARRRPVALGVPEHTYNLTGYYENHGIMRPPVDTRSPEGSPGRGRQPERHHDRGAVLGRLQAARLLVEPRPRRRCSAQQRVLAADHVRRDQRDQAEAARVLPVPERDLHLSTSRAARSWSACACKF